MANNAKVVDLIDRELNIPELSEEDKSKLRLFYYEMPTGVRMDIAMHITEIFPEIPAELYVKMRRDCTLVDPTLKGSSALLKIFNDEVYSVRFLFDTDWLLRLKQTIFEGSWCPDALLYGLRNITALYAEELDEVRNIDLKRLQFMANYLRAWLVQKEGGWRFFIKLFPVEGHSRIFAPSISLCEIVDEYLRSEKTSTTSRVALEKLFYAILQEIPSDKKEDNIFFILDVMKAAGVHVPAGPAPVPAECAQVSVVTESTISDNIGQVSIFGTHDFGAIPVEEVKRELIHLDRNNIAEYFGGKPSDNHIAFDISDQVKMMLREELSPSMCAVAIKRGNEVDMATLLTHESKIYLLFRKIGDNSTTYGITLGSMENGERELIGISNESDFTYSLVGGEEIGIKE